MFRQICKLACFLCLMVSLSGCEDRTWNNPYPNDSAIANTFYTAFAERPKHLDPAISYSSGEWAIISQVYEPLLQYHYLKRPYQLEPLLATEVPQPIFLDKHNQIIPTTHANPTNVQTSEYVIQLRQDAKYHPHPMFAKSAGNAFLYHDLNLKKVLKHKVLADFQQTGSRIATAADCIYQIKRLADPKLNSPIFGFMALYIQGLNLLRDELKDYYKENPTIASADLRKFNLSGVQQIDDFSFKIIVKGMYPQFVYWLAMPFFAPVPWESTQFYAQPGMNEHNINLDWYPVGTGPYQLIENNPERRIVLIKNPNFHSETYPVVGEKLDAELGLLRHAGKTLPFVDTILFSLEKENIPYWSKFIQGYYDVSGISSDNFNNAIDTTPNGGLGLTEALQEKNIRLQTSVAPTIMYWAFNMLDDTVGGYSEKQRLLRQAISIAFDIEEFIHIFTNGRGVAANGPIPPGIKGHSKQPNSYVYNTAGTRRSLEEAKVLLAKAGYPEGRNSETGEPLTLNFEAISSGDPDEKALFAWIQKQLNKLGIELIIRATDYNRFREKMHNGDAQLFAWGWNADYPDPENFLFMFYGPNGKSQHGGENAANYANAEFDTLFEQYKTTLDITLQQQLLQKMIALLQQDAPWIWGYNPKTFTLYHQWYDITKPNGMARNTFKYIHLNPEERAVARTQWNQPILRPFIWFILICIAICIPAWVGWVMKQRRKPQRIKMS